MGFTHSGPEAQQLGSAMARGEIDTVPRSPGIPDSLKGAADLRTMWLYRPRTACAGIRVPTLIIDQEDAVIAHR